VTQSFLKFSLSGISGTVQSAKLKVFDSNDATNNGPASYKADSSWTESGITWNNQPTAAGTVTTSAGTGWRDWVVTSMVQSMYSSGTNYGFLIRDAVEGASGTQVFSSRESGTNTPKLVITYIQGP